MTNMKTTLLAPVVKWSFTYPMRWIGTIVNQAYYYDDLVDNFEQNTIDNAYTTSR